MQMLRENAKCRNPNTEHEAPQLASLHTKGRGGKGRSGKKLYILAPREGAHLNSADLRAP